MLFCGIDQSYTETAITFLTSPDNYNIFSIKGKGRTSFDKLFHIRDNVKFLLTEQKEKPIVTCIEGGSYGSSGRLFSLGQLSGVIINVFFDWGISNILEIPPTTLKLFISGMGDASKEVVINAIQRKYGYSIKNDNKADSFSLALLAYRIQNNQEFKFREEAEVVHRLLNKPEKKQVRKGFKKGFNM